MVKPKPQTIVLREPQPTLVVAPAQVEVHLNTSFGRPGEQGPPGPAGGLVDTFTAGQILGGHRVVKSDAAGLAVYASNDNLLGGNLIGITLGAAANGDPVQVQRSGRIFEPSWTWTPDLPIFLGVNGLLTQVYPVAAALSIVVAFALTPTSIFVAPREPIRLS